MSLMGPQGLQRVAEASHAAHRELVAALTRVKGVRAAFSSPTLPRGRADARSAGGAGAESAGIAAEFSAVSVSPSTIPSSATRLLVCATETRTTEDIEAYAAALGDVMTAARAA